MDILNLEGVIALAAELHAGQMDKGGYPYLGHLERVAEMVRRSGGTWVQEQAAWLHDSIEDTFATAEYLLGRGVAASVVRLVVVVTHEKGVSNEDYWAEIRDDEEGADLLKFCDSYDNMNPARLCYVPPKDRNRLRRKYANLTLALTEP